MPPALHTSASDPAFGDASQDVRAGSLRDALLVYAEPLVNDAHVVVLGDSELGLAEQLVELGARAVHVYDPDPDRAARVGRGDRRVTVRALEGDLDVRDGAFDLAVVPDVGALPDPGAALGRLRRAVSAGGAVVAMARALGVEPGASEAFAGDLSPATLEYAALYDLFALQFEDVTMTGVLPFRGIVFAELGTDEDTSPAVSVDTRLAPPEAPTVFVVVAAREPVALDPYAIIQIAQPDEAREPAIEEASFAAERLKVELLATQLDEARERLAAAEGRGVEGTARFERVVSERDAAMTRASELESVLGAAQQTIATLEKRLASAEQGMLERDDRIAALHAELDARVEPEALVDRPDPAVVADLTARAERAEAALALNVADLAQVAEAHARETGDLEEQLRERAHVIAELEKELARREALVRELVASLEEAREGGVVAASFEPAPPLPSVPPRELSSLREETERLRRKLDAMAAEIARREGELVARGWRIQELESERRAAPPPPRGDGADPSQIAAELARTRDELAALQKALAQEHAARVAAESGEELARARQELARQAALLEQMRARTP